MPIENRHGPVREVGLRRALVTSRGDWLIFVQRPLSASILPLAVAAVLVPLIIQF